MTGLNIPEGSNPPPGLYDPRQRSGKANRPVLVVSADEPNTSFVFESGSAAAHFIGVSQGTVSTAKRTGAILSGCVSLTAFWPINGPSRRAHPAGPTHWLG